MLKIFKVVNKHVTIICNTGLKLSTGTQKRQLKKLNHNRLWKNKKCPDEILCFYWIKLIDKRENTVGVSG